VNVIKLNQAKNRLDELIDRVEQGERILIAKQGRLVAELRPLRDRVPGDIRAAIATLREFRERNKRRLAGLRATELISAGRKY
jgi:prevent-host-death family protein